MATETVEVAAPVAQDRLTAEIAAESAQLDGVPKPPYGDPFGDTSGQAGHCNVMSHNSPVWPRETFDGNRLVAGRHVPAQHFENAGGEPAKVVKTGALLVDAVLSEYPSVAERDSLAGYVLTKVSEALAFRIGVVESVAEDVLSHELGVKLAERALETVAQDEHNGIDIRGKNGDVWNVKYESNNATKEGVKRIDVTNLKNGRWEIEVEV